MSNKDIATIDPNTGELTAKDGGFISVIAQSYDNGKRYFKSKNVRVNFPMMLLRSSYEAGSGYYVETYCTSEKDTKLLNEAIREGGIKFIWGKKNIFDNIVWEDPVGIKKYIIGLPEKDEVVTVFMKVVDSSGTESKVYSIDVNKNHIVQVGYEGILVDKDKRVFLAHEDGYDLGCEGRSYYIYGLKPELLGNDRDKEYSNAYSLMIDGSGIILPATVSEVSGYYIWSFDLFNSLPFKSALNEVLLHAGYFPKYAVTIRLSLLGQELEVLQKMNFTILTSSFVNITEYNPWIRTDAELVGKDLRP